LLARPLLLLQLCDLYENDCIFDKFDCCINGNGKYVASGSYNNTFRVFGVADPTDVTLEASRDPMRRRLQQPQQRVRRGMGQATCAGGMQGSPQLMFQACLLHV
jgi:hypothetical protein